MMEVSSRRRKFRSRWKRDSLKISCRTLSARVIGQDRNRRRRWGIAGDIGDALPALCRSPVPSRLHRPEPPIRICEILAASSVSDACEPPDDLRVR